MATARDTGKADIVIAGGSLAGLTLALALARCLGPELDVVVVDRAAPLAPLDHAGCGSAVGNDDPRAVTVAASSRRMLEALGVWHRLREAPEPVKRIEITDSSLDAGLRPVLLAWDNALGAPPGVELAADDTAAHIVRLPALTAAVVEALAAQSSIRVMHGTEAVGYAASGHEVRLARADGPAIAARLAVAADGQRSAVRRSAGIKTVGWPYAQTGIAATVAHSIDHGGVAVQHFLPAGPFAILPLGGRRSSITWTEGEEAARRIMTLDDAAFLDEVDRRIGGRLGALSLAGGRRAWPLAMHLARSYVAPRLALIGDAAHGVHPIAGQGLNLAMRDVAALTEVVADAARIGLDFGDAIALARYERWRRFDSMAAAAAFDAINRLFADDTRLLRSAREFGLQVVDRLPGLKRRLIDEAAGVTGELPKLLRGELA